MGSDRLTVICHFRNEEFLLPYWLRHHARLFDHGILLDYGSTDRSRDIIGELAPSWEVLPSRNAQFRSLSIDAEVMDIERGIAGWKMCLNVTEFLLHHDLRAYLAGFEALHPGAPGVVTTGFVIQDAPEQLDAPLTDSDLREQRHFGCAEPDPGHDGHSLRSRLLHRAPHGAYNPGRHSNGVSAVADPPLYLFWYGWCPLWLKKRRNRSTTAMLSASDLARGWGLHHALDDEAIEETWREKYLPHCYDLFAGGWPGLNKAVEKLRACRQAASAPTTG
jgi:hypothetical protein